MRGCAERLAQMPLSQLAAMKLIVNQAYENMGLHSTQLLGPVLDGYMRNTPEALRFVDTAAQRKASPPPSQSVTGRSATTAKLRRHASRARIT